MSDRYYKKEVFKCKECGRQWETPGAAEICYKKDKILELTEELDGHKHHNLNDAIGILENLVNAEGEEFCPICGSEPADVSWQTAPGQNICTGDCPINSWGGVDYDD